MAEEEVKSEEALAEPVQTPAEPAPTPAEPEKKASLPVEEPVASLPKESTGEITPQVPLETTQSSPPTQPEISQPFIAKLLERARAKIFSNREKKLAIILAFLQKEGKITNDQVQRLIKVSDATATRYLEILEKRGQVRQLGERGRGVFYQKV